MSPKFAMRPTIDWSISRSEKPWGERMKDWRLAMPVLTSRLSLRRVYLCVARRRMRDMRLSSHATRKIMAVHVKTAMPMMADDATLARFSNQTIMTARMTARMVLATASGVIQGLPVQIGVVDCVVVAANGENRLEWISLGYLRLKDYLVNKFKIHGGFVSSR